MRFPYFASRRTYVVSSTKGTGPKMSVHLPARRRQLRSSSEWVAKHSIRLGLFELLGYTRIVNTLRTVHYGTYWRYCALRKGAQCRRYNSMRWRRLTERSYPM